MKPLFTHTHTDIYIYINKKVENNINYVVGRHSSVRTATRYGLDGPGIECRWGVRIPAPVQTVLWPTQPPIQRVPGLSRG